MIIEILIILLIIIVLLILLLFFKTWYIHVLFQNYNSDHYLSLKINILLLQINVEKILSETEIKFYLKYRNHIKLITTKNLNSKENTETESDDESEDGSDNSSNNQYFSKSKKISKLLLDSKEELYRILKLLISIIKFDNSYLKLNIGLGDNNLTIKLCNLIWALSAPLYPLRFQLFLKPEINQTIVKSDGDISFSIKLFNLIKIVFIIIKNRNLRELVKEILG